MAKGIAKTIKKLPDTDNFVFKESYDRSKRGKKKKSVVEAQGISVEAMMILGYTDADIRVKKAIGRV
jgi:hypothetical protein